VARGISPNTRPITAAALARQGRPERRVCGMVVD
jgi:hypothetical protein